MSEENGNGRDNAREITGGNVVDILTEFNNSKSASPTESEEVVETKVATESATDLKEEVVEKTEVEELTEDEKEWIIKGKFKSDEDGIKALAESYRSLQGEYDKKNSEFSEKEKHFEGLAELESWLIENPEAVKLLKQEYVGEADGPKPPEKPEDFQPLDIGVDGTPTNDWFLALNEYNVERGRREAQKEVEAFKTEMTMAEQKKQAEAERNQALIDAGLSADEIDDYNSFMRNPEVSNSENLVKIYRVLSGKQQTKPTEEVSELENPAKKKVVKTVSAAAVSGSVPKVSSVEESRQNFLEGILAQGR